ncbi:MAG TPA: hypothetical protein VL307_19390 [Chitinophagaceae bacterium]|nr:hypothetical protein [Chitinophagaceae bacterium]
MYVYENLLEALQELNKRGFIYDFNLHAEGIYCHAIELSLSPSQFEIVEHHRFEADTNPGDSSIVYAIRSKDAGISGVLVNAYGAYGDAFNDAMIQQLRVHE